MKSFMASPSTIEREWYVVDATGHTLGRLASEIATILRGKNKPTYTPHRLPFPASLDFQITLLKVRKVICLNKECSRQKFELFHLHFLHS